MESQYVERTIKRTIIYATFVMQVFRGELKSELGTWAPAEVRATFLIRNRQFMRLSLHVSKCFDVFICLKSVPNVGRSPPLYVVACTYL